MNAPTWPSPVSGAPVAAIGPPALNTNQTSLCAAVMVGWSTKRNSPRLSPPDFLAGRLAWEMLAITRKVRPPSVLSATGTWSSTSYRYVMNKFPWLSKDRLGSQHPSPSGSLPPRAISFLAHVLPPSKLTPSNIPAVSPASAWPTLVTVTMLLGLVGLTAIASSDSFRCRWLTSMLTVGTTAARSPGWAEATAAGMPAIAAAVSTAITTVRSRKRHMLSPSCQEPWYCAHEYAQRAARCSQNEEPRALFASPLCLLRRSADCPRSRHTTASGTPT